MTRRMLRTVPLAVLMTTALSWNLPATAQGLGNPPPAARTGPAQKAPPATGAPESAPATGQGTDQATGERDRLPADLMPAPAASAPDRPAPAGAPPKRGASPQPAAPQR